MKFSSKNKIFCKPTQGSDWLMKIAFYHDVWLEDLKRLADERIQKRGGRRVKGVKVK